MSYISSEVLENRIAAIQLQKSLDINPAVHGKDQSAGSIGTQMKEMMSGILSNLTYVDYDIKLTKYLPIGYSNTWLYQWGTQTSIGDIALRGSYTNSTTAKKSSDPAFNRDFVNLTIHQDTGIMPYVTNASAYYTVNPIQNLLQSKTKRMMLVEDLTYFWGSKQLDPLGQDGIIESHRKRGNAYLNPQAYSQLEEVKDMRGQRLNIEEISKAVNILGYHYANNSTFGVIAPYSSLEGLGVNDMLRGTNYYITADAYSNKANAILDTSNMSLMTKNGKKVNILSDLFASKTVAYPKQKINDTNFTPSATSPAKPVAGTNVAASGVTGYTKWAAADAGAYYYAALATNSDGDSRLTLINATPVTVAAGQHVDLTFTSGAGTYAETGYVIYRSVKDAPDATGMFYPLFNVTVEEMTNGYDGAAAGKVRDNNRELTGCETIAIIAMQNDTLFDQSVIERVELNGNPNAFYNGFNVLHAPQGVNPMGENLYFYHGFGLAHRTPYKTFIFKNVGV